MGPNEWEILKDTGTYLKCIGPYLALPLAFGALVLYIKQRNLRYWDEFNRRNNEERLKAYEFVRDLKEVGGVPRIYHWDYTTQFVDEKQVPVLTDIIGHELMKLEINRRTGRFDQNDSLEYLQRRIDNYKADAFSTIPTLALPDANQSTIGIIYHRFTPEGRQLQQQERESLEART